MRQARVLDSATHFLRFGIVGASKGFVEALDRAKAVAENGSSKKPVLLIGETGVGKDLIAKAIHRLGPRREKPFVVVPHLLESTARSELFGHVKGAFTGAHADKAGFFEAANGGAVYFSDVAAMPLEIQPMLLSVFDNKQIIRVGATAPIKTDVGVICATNQDLKQLTDMGLFREDLYYRLNVLSIEIPPLRERPGDIPALVEYFLRQHGVQGKLEVEQKTLTALMESDWPGNVRQLEAAVSYAIAFAQDGNRGFNRELMARMRKEVNQAGDKPTCTLMGALLQAGSTRGAARSLGLPEATLRKTIAKSGLRLLRDDGNRIIGFQPSDGNGHL